MNAKSVRDQHHPDHHEECQREHDHRRIAADEMGKRIRCDEHDPDGYHDRDGHHGNIASHSDRCQDRIDRENKVENGNLGNGCAKADDDMPLFIKHFAARFWIHRVMDFLGCLPKQEQSACDKNQVTAAESGFKCWFAMFAEWAGQAEVENWSGQPNDPGNRPQKRQSHEERKGQPDPPRTLLLFGREFVGKNGNEDKIVYPQNYFEDDKGEKGDPDAWIRKKSNHICHGRRFATVLAIAASRLSCTLNKGDLDMNDPAQRPDATPTTGGFEFNRPTIIGLLFAASYVTGITAIIGVVLAYVWKGESHLPWEGTHYTYLIRTFWIGVVASVLGVITLLIGVGFLILLAVGVWGLVRTVMSLINAQKREPMKDPETLLF